MSKDQTRNDTESVGEDRSVTEIKFYEAMNLRLADEVNFLRKILESQQDVIHHLMSKLLRAPKNLDPNYSPPDMEPIGGYQSLNTKIREAEEKAQRDFQESQDASKK